MWVWQKARDCSQCVRQVARKLETEVESEVKKLAALHSVVPSESHADTIWSMLQSCQKLLRQMGKGQVLNWEQALLKKCILANGYPWWKKELGLQKENEDESGEKEEDKEDEDEQDGGKDEKAKKESDGDLYEGKEDEGKEEDERTRAFQRALQREMRMVKRMMKKHFSDDSSDMTERFVYFRQIADVFLRRQATKFDIYAAFVEQMIEAAIQQNTANVLLEDALEFCKASGNRLKSGSSSLSPSS